MAKNKKKEKKIVMSKKSKTPKVNKPKVLRCKDCIQFVTSMKHNLDVMCTAFKSIVTALNETNCTEETELPESDNPEEELCPPSNSTSNNHYQIPVVHDKSRGFKSYFNIQSAANEQKNYQTFHEDIPNSSSPKKLELSEAKSDFQHLVGVEETNEETGNYSVDSLFNNSCDVLTSSLCAYNNENSTLSIQNENFKEESYKPAILPMASSSILFQGGLFKVKISNLKSSVKYEDINGILSEIGVDNNTVEDIMLVNHIQKTFAVISFNDNANMMKALSSSRKINHQGRVITIKPVSHR